MGGMSSRFKIRVVSGPSGSGKSSLIKRLNAEYKDYLSFCVSHTTRNPREGEENGKDYHFVTRDEFLEMVQNDCFIEHTEFSSNLYGTSKTAIKAAQQLKKICILDVDIKGVQSLKKSRLRPIYIFIKPPSIETLESRLLMRKTETPESVKQRIESANVAMNYAMTKDVYHHIIINENLEEAYNEFKNLFITDINAIQKSLKRKREIHN